MFWIQSWTLQLAKCSRPLRRLLSEANTNLPVLTLFTKDCILLCMTDTTAVHLMNTMKTGLERYICQYGNPCPLCDEAKAVLEPYKHKFLLQEVDITLPVNSSWFEKYKYDIPVFHLNGKFLMKHRVDIKKLENRLLALEMQDDGNR